MTICMCVHGAGQKEVNPQVRVAFGLPEESQNKSLANQLLAVKESLTPETWQKGSYYSGYVDAEHVSALACPGATRTPAIAGKDFSSIWNNRPEWVRNDYIHNGKNFGKAELHYLMGMFGLTISFNDDQNTTLAMIHEKLDRAIAWAQEKGI